jgi:hypothetical protein
MVWNGIGGGVHERRSWVHELLQPWVMKHQVHVCIPPHTPCSSQGEAANSNIWIWPGLVGDPWTDLDGGSSFDGRAKETQRPMVETPPRCRRGLLTNRLLGRSESGFFSHPKAQTWARGQLDCDTETFRYEGGVPKTTLSKLSVRLSPISFIVMRI